MDQYFTSEILLVCLSSSVKEVKGKYCHQLYGTHNESTEGNDDNWKLFVLECFVISDYYWLREREHIVHFYVAF